MRRTTINCALPALLFFCITQFASAFYDPSIGRWPNRDPHRELGFRNLRHRNTRANPERSNLYKFVLNDPIIKVDALGLYTVTGSGCPCGETLAQINSVGGYYAFQAWRLAGEASGAAQNSGLPGIHNGPADAFRPCLWSCLMAQELNPSIARIVGDIHERCGDDPPAEHAMDSANNAAGRSFGSTPGADCRNLCLGAVYEGELQNDPGGTPPSLNYVYHY